ncbi:MAG: SCO family protein [Chloroflexaceae bacterium]|jgi:protein SCO1/2|nr:SCO family protein [Chloroflexaceae bacterium]
MKTHSPYKKRMLSGLRSSVCKLQTANRKLATVLLLLLLSMAGPALAQDDSLPAPVPGQKEPPALRFDQRLNQPLPLDLSFTDEDGSSVTLRNYFGHEKPVILSLGYYQCPMLCPLTREGLLESLQGLDLDIGKQFTVVNLSIDPKETYTVAAAQKASYVQRYGRAGAADGWHFLTGDEASIKQLTDAVGFEYMYDQQTQQYAHPAGIVLATPQGQISRYLYGISYIARDLRLGLVEASENKIGSLTDQLLLLCFHYDPESGSYTGTVINLVRGGALLTALVLGFAIMRMLRREDVRQD